MVPDAKIPADAGYQVPFAERIRREAGISAAAVSFITETTHADEIIPNGRADMVLPAREFLREPYWPHKAARALGLKDSVFFRDRYRNLARYRHKRYQLLTQVRQLGG
jgi:2,4-dienoyl-CoA reductase-like NADH-dependent reductase (Old Yellow Enzyme family)